MRHDYTRTPTPAVHRRAFTLVELLVVIGLIALLISIVIPVLGGARRRAQQIHCAANLHTLGIAMQRYVTANRCYPGTYVAPIGRFFQFAVWPTRIRGQLGGDRNAFYCPSRDPDLAWTGRIPR